MALPMDHVKLQPSVAQWTPTEEIQSYCCARISDMKACCAITNRKPIRIVIRAFYVEVFVTYIRRRVWDGLFRPQSSVRGANRG